MSFKKPTIFNLKEGDHCLPQSLFIHKRQILGNCRICSKCFWDHINWRIFYCVFCKIKSKCPGKATWTGNVTCIKHIHRINYSLWRRGVGSSRLQCRPVESWRWWVDSDVTCSMSYVVLTISNKDVLRSVTRRLVSCGGSLPASFTQLCFMT